MRIEQIKLAYHSGKQALIDLADHEEEEGPLDEEQKALWLREAEISPELEAEYQKIRDREDELFKRRAKEMMQEEKYRGIPEEVFDEVLQEVIDKDGIENEDDAYAFFEEQWDKLVAYHEENKERLKTPPLRQPDAAFLNSKHYNDKWTHSEDYLYESVSIDEFVLDRENEEKYHLYHHERIGRYP